MVKVKTTIDRLVTWLKTSNNAACTSRMLNNIHKCVVQPSSLCAPNSNNAFGIKCRIIAHDLSISWKDETARHETRRRQPEKVSELYMTEQKKTFITVKACEVYLEAVIARTDPLKFTTRLALLKTDKIRIKKGT